jgi:prepilin-type N-terminal cleavage/methylation domain-containing protein
MQLNKKNDKGFTLIELMIAMVIALVVIASIYRVYQTQQKAYSTQQLVVEMQQNARSAITLMKREIRMAGYRPAASDGIDNDGDGSVDANDDDENGRKPGQEIGIMTAEKDRIMFRMDNLPDDPATCSDGLDDPPVAGLVDDPAECYDGLADDADEQITYALQPNAAGNGNDLVRITSAGTNILAYDIEAIAFGYAFDADGDGSLDTDNGAPDGNVIWAYGPAPGMVLDTDAQTGAALASAYPVIDLPDRAPIIGAVRIWLLARTPHPVRGELDTHTYQVGDQVIDSSVYDPAYRHTLQIATVYCRNMRF